MNIDNSQIRLILKYQKTNFISYYFDINKINEKINNNGKNNEENNIKLYEINENIINKNKYIICNIKIEENIDNDKFIGAYEKEFQQNVKIFSKKRKIIIYNKCLIINKTDFILYLRSSDIKRQNSNSENYNGKIFPNSVNILNTKDVKNTFKLKSENSDWSNKFNINTIGHIGVISLEINEGNNNNKKDLEISISISSSFNFPNSLFIIIEPRFILINKFGYDLEYKQYNNKKSKENNDNGNYFKSKIIKKGEELKLNLMKGDKNLKKMIQIKLGEYSRDYSCPFNLDEIGDVDLKIPINEKMKEKLLKKNIEIEKKIEKLKKKERIKNKLLVEEEKNKEEEEKLELKKDSKDKNENNIRNIEKDNNIKNIANDDINNNSDNIINSNININDIMNNNINKEYNKNELRNIDIFSESEKTLDDDEMSTDSFSFIKKSEKFSLRKSIHKELTPNQERLKKIEERNKKLKKVEMKPRKYYIFNQNNESYLLLRVTKSIFKGLIYIVIFPPENPQYVIKNQTDFKISLRQKKDSFYEENIILEKGEILPYSWRYSFKN